VRANLKLLILFSERICVREFLAKGRKNIALLQFVFGLI